MRLCSEHELKWHYLKTKQIKKERKKEKKTEKKKPCVAKLERTHRDAMPFMKVELLFSSCGSVPSVRQTFKRNGAKLMLINVTKLSLSWASHCHKQKEGKGISSQEGRIIKAGMEVASESQVVGIKEGKKMQWKEGRICSEKSLINITVFTYWKVWR